MKTLNVWTLVTLIICALAGSGVMARPESAANNAAQGQQQQQRDQLGFLKRVLTQSGATALTTQQEADLNTLVTNFRSTLPTEPDATLKAAHEAYAAAILAGDLAAAQAQAAIIATQQTQLGNDRLTAEAKFAIAALAILKAGGQLDGLTQKLGADRVVGLVISLAGGHPFGGPGGGRGGPGGFGGGPRGGGPGAPPPPPGQ